MREFSSLELIKSHSWTSSLFTTYSLSLGYFEAVILDALVRQDVRNNLILADVDGVRAALSEHGAQQTGRSYQIEPIAVDNGCFHAKLMVLASSDENHIVVGSGNLTVGGWGSNLECIEHLHPSFAADAFNDAADFFESLARSDVVHHSIDRTCDIMAIHLRRASANGQRNGNIRLVSNLNGPIFDRLAEFAEDLGGATRLTLASPFFDGGPAIDTLCTRLGLDTVHIHAHPKGTVAGDEGANWPSKALNKVSPVAIESFADDERSLHAKVYEVLCRRGRILMSGSSNATNAGLDRARNVELNVVRIERKKNSGWKLSPAIRPAAPPRQRDEHSNDVKIGILRATLRGDVLTGELLTKFDSGDAFVFQHSNSGPIELGKTNISQEGKFTIRVRGLGLQSWKAQRLIIRVQSAKSDAIAEGFVSFPDIADVTRRIGSNASQFLALLSGTETPADVSAVMSWFCDHPDQLKRPLASGGHASTEPEEDEEVFVNVSELLHPNTLSPGLEHFGPSTTSAGWRRFMAQVFASFREPRGKISSVNSVSDDVEDGQNTDPPSTDTPAGNDIDDAMFSFDYLFDLLLGGHGGHQDLVLALQISQYVCDRLDFPASTVETYLTRFLAALSSSMVPEEDRSTVAAAAFLSASRQQVSHGNEFSVRSARRSLLRLGYDITGSAPDLSPVHSFSRILSPTLDAVALWDKVRKTKTFQEEIRQYRLAPPGYLEASDFPALSSLQEWKDIANATESFRKGVYFIDKHSGFCPKHFIGLPEGELSKLKSFGLGRARSCCSAFLMCEEI